MGKIDFGPGIGKFDPANYLAKTYVPKASDRKALLLTLREIMCQFVYELTTLSVGDNFAVLVEDAVHDASKKDLLKNYIERILRSDFPVRVMRSTASVGAKFSYEFHEKNMQYIIKEIPSALDSIVDSVADFTISCFKSHLELLEKYKALKSLPEIKKTPARKHQIKTIWQEIQKTMTPYLKDMDLTINCSFLTKYGGASNIKNGASNGRKTTVQEKVRKSNAGRIAEESAEQGKGVWTRMWQWARRTGQKLKSKGLKLFRRL